ncbi:MAG: metallophosphoesterase [Thermoplasmatota archaeon]
MRPESPATSDSSAPSVFPVFGERALFLRDARALVVGDLHVGLEADLDRSGVRIASQTRRMRERLDALVASTGARSLYVIGDLKHTIPTSTWQEADELPGFFSDLGADVTLVRGNHDVDIDYLRDVALAPSEGVRVGDVGLAHGHAWPSEEVAAARTLVTCHNHPAVMLVDRLGARHKEPAWVRARFTKKLRERYPGAREDAELVVMPAFNELVAGTAFNAPQGRDLLGPLFVNGCVDVERARLITLDGVELGTVKALRKWGEPAKAKADE